MHTLSVIAEVLLVGAVVTLIGARVIAWSQPPRGRFVAVNGLRQHVVELGAAATPDAPPIVLIHGASCNLCDMQMALADKLAPRHRLLLVDRAGLGWSERASDEGSSPAYQAGMLRDVLDALGVKRAIVVGHSWGGALAARFALDHAARTAGLVLIAPPLYPFSRRATWFYELAALPGFGWLFAHTVVLPFGVVMIAPAMMSAFLPQRPPHRYLARSALLLVLRPATFLANARDVAHLKFHLAEQAARYRELSMPAVVITGDRDLIVSPRHHALALAAESVPVRLVTLPGIGHMPHHVATERVVAEIEAIARAAAAIGPAA
jgi:pimeloyl-ACP methyl ester carboxylesterase